MNVGSRNTQSAQISRLFRDTQSAQQARTKEHNTYIVNVCMYVCMYV